VCACAHGRSALDANQTGHAGRLAGNAAIAAEFLAAADAAVIPLPSIHTSQNCACFWLIPLKFDHLLHSSFKPTQPPILQLNGQYVSPCCPIFCPIVAHSIVNTMGQTTGHPPVALCRWWLTQIMRMHECGQR